MPCHNFWFITKCSCVLRWRCHGSFVWHHSCNLLHLVGNGKPTTDRVESSWVKRIPCSAKGTFFVYRSHKSKGTFTRVKIKAGIIFFSVLFKLVSDCTLLYIFSCRVSKPVVASWLQGPELQVLPLQHPPKTEFLSTHKYWNISMVLKMQINTKKQHLRWTFSM